MAAKASALRKGKIVFYDDYASKRPDTPPCITFSIYYQRGPQAGIYEQGGWWSVRVSDFDADVKGPFASERESIDVARAMAARCGE